MADDNQPVTPATAPGSTLSPGALLASRYEIVDYIGKGGMGVVYRAHDRTLDETVAIKILSPHLLDDPLMAQRLLAEIKLARRVTHKNVCRIHDYGQDGPVAFISMEFVDGVELRQMVRERKGLGADEGYDIALQLVDGLNAIHEQGIVHRDLKTANVMVDRRGAARLMDFGIAKLWEATRAEGLTAHGHIIGTPAYMSPEQAMGEPLDPRSDIYSMGVVLFELFTGTLPFTGNNAAAVLLEKLSDTPLRDSLAATRLPPALRSVIDTTLAQSVDRRYASARDLRAALLDARVQTPSSGIDTTTTLITRVQELSGSGKAAATKAPAPSDAAVPTPQRAGVSANMQPVEAGARTRRGGLLSTITAMTMATGFLIWIVVRIGLPWPPWSSREQPPSSTATVPASARPEPAAATSSRGAPLTAASPSSAAPISTAASISSSSAPPASSDGTLTAACNNGDGAACVKLALSLQQAVPPDLRRAADLYRKACDAGHPRGCTQVGQFFNRALGVTRDIAQAAVYYERGCALGDMDGCNNLGTLYQFGSMGFRDAAKAAQFYEQACSAGHLDGCTNLGLLYMDSTAATPDQQRRARTLLEKACSAGVARACSKLR